MSLGEDLSSPCYYKNLGLSKGASDAEIKSAYKRMALKHHPDKNTDSREIAEENFKKVAEAYDVLSDKQKREIYDTYGKRGLEGGSGGCGRGGGGFGGGHYGVNPEDLFRQFFGGHHYHDSFDGYEDHMGGGGFPFDGFGGGHSRASHKRPAPPPVYPSGPDVIPKGTSVYVHSLANAQEYNGMEGKLIGYDPSKRRYTVSFGENNEDKTIAIKTDNFIQLVKNVRLHDIQSRPQLNQCTGSIIGISGERLHVRLNGASESACVGVPLSNLILPSETRVHVHGLVSAPQYNGETGRIVQYLSGENRYLIEIPGPRQLKLKTENISL